MRLEVTRRSDLAIRALVTVASADRRVKASELADRLGTTIGFVPQVVGPLVKQGWMTSEPGPAGGYSATMPLAQLDVLSVIEAVEGPTDAGRCVVEDRPCGGSEHCALHDGWLAARRQLTTSLRSLTLDRLDHSRSPLTTSTVAERP